MPTKQETANNLKSKFQTKKISSPGKSKHEVKFVLSQIMPPSVENILKKEFLSLNVQSHIRNHLIVDSDYIWEKLLEIELIINSLTLNHLYNSITYDILSEDEKKRIIDEKRNEFYYENCVYNLSDQTITMKQVYLDIIIDDLENNRYSAYTYGFFSVLIHESIHALYHLIDAPFYQKQKEKSEKLIQDFLNDENSLFHELLFDYNNERGNPGDTITSYMINATEFPSFYNQVKFMLESDMKEEKIVNDIAVGYCNMLFSEGQYGRATCFQKMKKFVRRVIDIIQKRSSRDDYQKSMGQQQLDLGNWYQAYNQFTAE
jgi:hypothetical protein